MQIPIKRFSETEYVKNILILNHESNCVNCKYDLRNYESLSISVEFKHFCENICKTCAFYYKYKRIQNVAWITDKYKPLYEWEDSI